MGVDFVWEVHDEEDEPVVPPPARPTHHPPIQTLRDGKDKPKRGPRRLRRVPLLVGCLLLAALIGAWRYVADTAHRNLRLAEADLLAVVQTEVRALAHDDEPLYRSLQAQTTFVSTQFAREQRLLAEAAPSDKTGRQLLGLSWHGDQADVWVGYTAGGATYARLQGYQLTDGRWLRTRVSQRRWGAVRTLQTAHFRFRYHAAEAEAVSLLAPWAEALYANLDFDSQTMSDPIVVELYPYLAQPLAWTGRHRVMLTSPLLVGVSPVQLRTAPLPETLIGLAYTPEGGQGLLADTMPLDPRVIAAFSYAVALTLANDRVATNLYSDGVHWLMAEAAARYAVERLVPALVQGDEDAAVLRALMSQGTVLPLSALWSGAVVMASVADCNDLSSIERPWGACYGRGDEGFRQALAQAKSLIAFAEEQAVIGPPGVTVTHFSLVSRFLAAVAVSGEGAAIRYLWQDAAQDGRVANPEAAQFFDEPERFVAAWHNWLQERYG